MSDLEQEEVPREETDGVENGEEKEAIDAQAEAEKLAEITKKNKDRVLFTKPTVKYIVSHHSGEYS